MADEKEFLLNQAPQDEDAADINPMTGRPYEVFSDDVNEGVKQESEVSSQEPGLENDIPATDTTGADSDFSLAYSQVIAERDAELENSEVEDEEEDDEEEEENTDYNKAILILGICKDIITLVPIIALFGIFLDFAIWILLIKKRTNFTQNSINLLFTAILEQIPLVQALPFSSLSAYFMTRRQKK